MRVSMIRSILGAVSSREYGTVGTISHLIAVVIASRQGVAPVGTGTTCNGVGVGVGETPLAIFSIFVCMFSRLRYALPTETLASPPIYPVP